VVALLDVSTTADAIIADDTVATVADLKGKPVAYEEGTTSDILLNYALAQVGMSTADIQRVPMPAADAGAALIGGRVPVAVTYEPYLSLAMLQDPGVKLLFTAGENPGLISDVLVVREQVLEERPGQVAALLRAWDQAYAAYQDNMEEGRAIIAEAVGATPEDLATAFEGVEFYSLADNREQLTGAYAHEVAPEVAAAAREAGLLTEDVDFDAMIDGRFVDAASR
jgi:NitT/TauT family transport system substrate-binding protein